MSNWNRIYRPQTVAQLHLDAVREQLQKILESGNLSQVFIFAGPKGTGKTSTARILGALVNNPHNEVQIKARFFKEKQENHSKSARPANRGGHHLGGKPLIDEKPTEPELLKVFQGNSFLVQEMDAASNRGIDDVRALKERVHIPPSFGLMSVYILDEAHMLTTEAFNALLKLLEEPPPHALFILATTELHKVPETILSRAQLIQFSKATTAELKATLQQILDAEKITYEDDALVTIAERADGSFRDAVKMLESLAAHGAVTVKEVQNLGLGSYTLQVSDLIQAIVEKDISKVVMLFQSTRAQNVSETHFHTVLLSTLHTALLQSLEIEKGKALVNFDIARFLLSELSDASLSQPSPLPLLGLEMKILDIITRAQKKSSPKEGTQSGPATPVSKPKPNPVPTKTQTMQASTVPEVATTPLEVVMPSASLRTANIDSSYSQKGDGSIILEKWQEFVDTVAVSNSTLAALLRSAHPINAGEGYITVQVFYTFHQEQLRQTKFNLIIRACAEEMIGGSLEFIFTVQEAPVTAEIQDVTNIHELSSVAVQALM